MRNMEVRLLIQSKVRSPQMPVLLNMEVRLLIQSKVRRPQMPVTLHGSEALHTEQGKAPSDASLVQHPF